jgi:DNA-binding response OmpR family regulator
VLLLVEDDFDLVSLFQLAAARAGLESRIATVADGEAAIAYLSRIPPYDDPVRHPPATHVLLDLRLPGKTGVDVLRWLRAAGSSTQTRIIAWTSFHDTRPAPSG